MDPVRGKRLKSSAGPPVEDLTSNEMDGYLLIDKPEGISSFRAVAKVRTMASQAAGQKVKVGHTGTLDPAASGLLILVLGKYTRKAADFSKLDKQYEAELTLGFVSSTGDKEGETSQKSTRRPTENQVAIALNKFLGDISQVPPVYSAIKVGGQRAYKLARSGQPVQLKSRPAKVISIDKIIYKYPKLSFVIRVSSGTYIRSIAEDIGTELGTGAYLSGLRRTEIGDNSLKTAVSLEGLDGGKLLRNLRTKVD